VDEQAYGGWRRQDGRYKDVLRRKGGVLCAKNQDRIIAHLVWERPSDDEESKHPDNIALPNSVHVFTLVVLPEFQRKGLGMSLLDLFMRQVACHHFEHVSLYCRWNNLPALKLYLRFGFAFQKAFADKYGLGTHAFLMSMRVADRYKTL